MRKIRVYLQSPLGISDSLYYKNILDYPPSKVEYITNIKKAEIIVRTIKRKIFNSLKSMIRTSFEKLNYAKLNIHRIPNNDADLIHCAHCLPITNKPWVADFEAPWQFWISGKNSKKGKKKFLEVVSQNNCKKLLAWTEKAKQDLAAEFPTIKKKIEVLNYAMPYSGFKKQRNRNITLLFISRYFYQKGGLDALEAMKSLTKKYSQVDAIVISDVPESIIKKFKSEKIKIFSLMPQKEIFDKIYPESDIFLYPGYSDTFGFGFIEAMNFGLPIVTVDGYARREIVKNEKTGFIIMKEQKINYRKVNLKIFKELVRYGSVLIEDRRLKSEMSSLGMYEIKKGKFSIKERNKKLKKIYEEAMK